MSHLQSMAILGIRSFSPDEPCYIKFFSPLTLIVGSNGAGKTTIIESLRYACTGDLPPNSKNGAFVNDPKVAGISEVKAQIKLKFYNINGQKMVCSRSLAVTQKKATVTQRSIDNALLRYDPVTGEAFSITSRCADMDSELPLHLGVPKAILDNVIFCHQEDSNWPLSEPSVLKKKFDDIFSSKRFTAALDNIKEIRKETATDIKLGNVQLEALKNDTKKAKRIRSNLTELNQQMTAKNETFQTIEIKLAQIEAEISRLNASLKDNQEAHDTIRQLLNQRDFFQSTMRSIEAHIVPREESTEQLQHLLEEHRIKEDKNQEEKSRVSLERSKLERQLKAAQDELSKKQVAMGRLDAARDEYLRQLQRRSALIQQMNQDKNMNLPVDDGDASAQVIKELIEDNATNNDRAKDEAMSEQNTLSDELQMLKSQKMSIEENKKHLKRLIDNFDIQIDVLAKKMKEFQVSEMQMDAIKAKIAEYEKKLAEMDAVTVSTSQDELKRKEHELRDVDDKISDLNEESARLSKQSDSRAKLSLKRTEKEVKETTMNRIYTDHINDIQNLLDSKPNIANLERELDVYKTKKEKELASLIEVRNKANRELSAADAKLNMVLQNYNKQKREADKFQSLIEKVCGQKDLPAELADTVKKADIWATKIAQIQGASMVYQKFRNTEDKSGCCPLCTRDFANNDEIEMFRNQLKLMQDFIPEKQQKMKEQLKEIEARKAKLLSAQGTWIKLESLKKDLASISSTKEAFETEKKAAEERNRVATAQLVEVDNCKIKADKLLLIARNVGNLSREVDLLTQDVQDLEKELEFSGSTRTSDDVMKELEELTERSKTIRRDMKRIHTEIDMNNRKRQSVERALNESSQKLIRLENERDRKVGMQLQLDDIKEQRDSRKVEYERPENDAEPLTEKIQAAKRLYDEAVQNWRNVEEKASAEEHKISIFAERLSDFNATVKKCAAAASPERLESLNSEITNLNNTIADIKCKVAGIDEKLAIIEKDEAERRGIERDLQDQIKYRDMQEQLAKCEQELAAANQSQDAVDVVSLQRGLQRADKEKSDLVDKRGSIRGEIEQMSNQSRRYEQELKIDYRDVDGRYGNLFIEVKTKELASEDLERYSKTLQAAIMKYHSLKMQDLNKIIKELWVDTYKGGDIDYIEIRADNEGSTASRTFNYRVVMIQNGSELNMRGRCSAGQKVLAAIIIRLALAETFCVNCGIFTLDEPTTNLDRANIESLAENLGRIIKNRSQQSNFQFVIITHDEEFVEYLSRDNILGQYYRVSKDFNQHSRIQLQGQIQNFNDNDEDPIMQDRFTGQDYLN
ncbi:ribosomal protein S23 [Mucor velutinosus]|uniref:DNA repair protein RAD50 n=1 Tax=Mucor velutinosus TaxID=708070 RepID=A0AAN7DNW6_9FUNG|nr:ribosomal protein S23 [Mucor velutinosus]